MCRIRQKDLQQISFHLFSIIIIIISLTVVYVAHWQYSLSSFKSIYLFIYLFICMVCFVSFSSFCQSTSERERWGCLVFVSFAAASPQVTPFNHNIVYRIVISFVVSAGWVVKTKADTFTAQHRALSSGRFKLHGRKKTKLQPWTASGSNPRPLPPPPAPAAADAKPCRASRVYFTVSMSASGNRAYNSRLTENRLKEKTSFSEGCSQRLFSLSSNLLIISQNNVKLNQTKSNSFIRPTKSPKPNDSSFIIINDKAVVAGWEASRVISCFFVFYSSVSVHFSSRQSRGLPDPTSHSVRPLLQGAGILRWLRGDAVGARQTGPQMWR